MMKAKEYMVVVHYLLRVDDSFELPLHISAVNTSEKDDDKENQNRPFSNESFTSPRIGRGTSLCAVIIPSDLAMFNAVMYP